MNQAQKTQGFTHERTFRGKTDTWLTPLSLIESLGQFDLDPCAFPHHNTAKRLICLPKDGLAAPWVKGLRVWLNPPYGPETAKWLERLSHHGTGTALVFARTETKWFQTFALKADAFLFLKGRVRFLRPDFSIGDCAAAPSMLLAFGSDDALALELSGIPGWFVRLKKNKS